MFRGNLKLEKEDRKKERADIDGRTVLFFVSGMKKYIIAVCIPHHMVKMMYVCQPILSMDTGQAN